MGHFIVFALAISLIIGSAAVIHSLQIYRSNRLPFLKALIAFMSIFNFVMLLNFISQYILYNINTLASFGTYFIVIVIMGLVGFISYFAEVYLFIFIIWQFFEKQIPKLINYSFIAVLCGWFISFAAGTILFINNNEKMFLLKLYSVTNVVVSLLFLILTLYLIWSVKHLSPGDKKHAIIFFGITYLIYCIVDTTSIIFPPRISHLAMVLNGIFLNITFLSLLKPFLKLFGGRTADSGDLSSSLDQFVEKFNISPREREIIEMILKGMSNKEIEAKIFISPSTVKNHIYHIFQKSGVKSRAQLTNNILRIGHH